MSVALTLFLAASCRAQDYVPAQPDNTLTPADPIGVPPQPTSAGTFEAVGNANGGLSFFLPVLSLPQRGGWTLTLGYFNTSPMWSLRQDVSVSINNYTGGSPPTATTLTYTENFQPYPSYGGLELNLPTLVASIEYTGDAVIKDTAINQTLEVPVFCFTNWVFTDWSGNKHPFTNRAVCSVAPTTQAVGSDNAYQLEELSDSTDGSWLSLDTSYYTPGSGKADLSVTTKDGTVYHFSVPNGYNPFSDCQSPSNPYCDNSSSQDGVYNQPFSSMSDPNGNTVSYNSSAFTLMDTIGRVISLNGGIIYTDSNGKSQTIQVTETAQPAQVYPLTPSLSCEKYHVIPPNVTVNFQNSGITSVTGVPFIDTINLPAADSTGTKRTYTLQFDGLDNLTQITYPGGGYTKYVYQFNGGYHQTQGLVQCTVPGEEVAQKRECPLSSGSCLSSQELVTTYAPQPNGSLPSNGGMTITDPSGNVTGVAIENYAGQTCNINFTAPHEVLRTIENSSGTVLQTIQTTYTQCVNGADVQLPSQVTTTLNDASPAISTVTNYQYEPYGMSTCYNGCGGASTFIDNPTEIDEYDYAQSGTGTLLKKTTQAWEPASAFTPQHILDRLQSRTVTDPASNFQETLSYGYNSNGYITSKTVSGTSVASLTTTYLRDSYGNITQVTDPRTNITKFAYTNNWQDSACTSLGPSAYLTSITDALSHVTNFSYYSCTGLRASATDPNGKKTSYSYDALGRPTLTSFPDTGSRTISYIDSVPNSFTQSELITSGLSRSQTTSLDGFDRKTETQLTSDPDGTDFVDTEYDSLGRVATVSNPYRTPNDAGPTNGTTTYSYDALDRILKVTEPDGSAVSTTYSGNVTTVTDEASKSRKSQADALGRLTNVWEDPSGLNYLTAYGYDAFGNLTNVVQNGSRTRSFQYNAFSQLTSATNPESNVITYTYDNDGNLATKTAYAENQTDSTPTVSHGSFSICCDGSVQDQGTIYVTVGTFNTQVDYTNSSTASSVASALAAALNGSNLVTASALNKVVNMTSIATGPSANYSLSSSSSGNINPPKFRATRSGSTMTGGANPPTVTVTYAYDALNRVTKKTYTDGTPTVTYLYDGQTVTGCTPSVSNSNPIYRRTGMCDGMGTEAWGYDSMGRVLADLRTTSNLPKTTSYTYNLDGSVATLTYPSGRTIAYTPGGAGLPLSAVDSANSINYATSAHYTPAGALASLTNGSNLSSTFIYNDRLQPCWMYAATGTALPWITSLCTNSATTGNILDLKYNFSLGAGDNGNVIGITNDRDSTRSQQFTYDSLNRITMGGTVGTSGTNCWGEQFGVDAWGNLDSRTLPSTYSTGCKSETPFSYTFGNNNQLPSGSGFTYDAAGNLMMTGTATYVYNGEEHMNSETTGSSTVTYSYDGDGRRVEKSGGTIYWYGMGSDALDETDLSGNLTNEYVFFGGKRVARRDASGNVFYYVADHLGTSREIVQAGQTSACYDADFFPYGGEIAPYANSCPQNYKFTGKERDSESGLDDFGSRYFASSFGRFMTPDWAARPTAVPYAVFGDPQSLNLYGYVRNDPVSSADPDGHCPDGCPLPSQVPQTLADLDRQNQNNGDFFVGALKGLVNFTTSAINLFATMGESAQRPIPQLQPTNLNQATGAAVATVGMAAGALAVDAPAASTIGGNAAKGAAFENSVVSSTRATDSKIAEQVTLKTESGVRTRMDVVSTKASGEVRLQEAKSSTTAPLTKNQQAAHPEIARSGATVVGQGKPGYPGGTRIPPTKVEVVRPDQQ